MSPERRTKACTNPASERPENARSFAEAKVAAPTPHIRGQFLLGMKARWSGEQYAEFHTGVGVLAIFSAEAQEKYIPGSSEAASNRSAILQFKVADVDHEYVRLQPLVTIWVKKPTTQPWGTRSVYFRDPDGNLVDFYMPAKID